MHSVVPLFCTKVRVQVYETFDFWCKDEYSDPYKIAHNPDSLLKMLKDSLIWLAWPKSISCVVPWSAVLPSTEPRTRDPTSQMMKWSTRTSRYVSSQLSTSKGCHLSVLLVTWPQGRQCMAVVNCVQGRQVMSVPVVNWVQERQHMSIFIWVQDVKVCQ
jgi:hypothetical protein